MNLKVISIHDDLLEIDLYEIVSCAEAVVSVRETLFPTVNQLLSVPTRKKYKPMFGLQEMQHSKLFCYQVYISFADSPLTFTSKFWMRNLKNMFN